jgi:hypothetical protein
LVLDADNLAADMETEPIDVDSAPAAIETPVDPDISTQAAAQIDLENLDRLIENFYSNSLHPNQPGVDYDVDGSDSGQVDAVKGQDLTEVENMPISDPGQGR